MPQETVQCSLCSDSIRIDEVWYYDDAPYCLSCHDSQFYHCENCGELFYTNSLTLQDEQLYCNFCYEKIKATIKEYSYKPPPIFHKTKRDEQSPFFGIELEVERKDSELAINEMAKMIEKPHHYFKLDRSLNEGFEIVTHPMTEKWIKNNKTVFSDALGHLINAGYKSYQTNTCGMHIHISRDSFSTWHLFRFMKFFYENNKFILIISQRKEGNLNQWAKLGIGNFENIIRMAKKKYLSSDRYTAINLTKNTVEVRVFRGTLKETSFFKNIEFVASLFEFTKLFNSDKITPKNYFDWLVLNTNKYKNLTNWLSEKSELIMMSCGYTYKQSKTEKICV